MEAVKNYGHAFRHASEELKRDREVVMEAVKHNSGAFQHASEELKATGKSSSRLLNSIVMCCSMLPGAEAR